MYPGENIEIYKSVEIITILHTETQIQLRELRQRLEIATTKLYELSLELERLQMIIHYEDLPNDLLEKTLF